MAGNKTKHNTTKKQAAAPLFRLGKSIIRNSAIFVADIFTRQHLEAHAIHSCVTRLSSAVMKIFSNRFATRVIVDGSHR